MCQVQLSVSQVNATGGVGLPAGGIGGLASGAGRAGTAGTGGASAAGGPGAAGMGEVGGRLGSAGVGESGRAAPAADDDAGLPVPPIPKADWVTTWGTTLGAADASTALLSGDTNASFAGVTLRQIVHTSLGGDHVRIRLSNVFGSQPVRIGSAHVALHDSGSSIVQSSDRPLTFSGASSTMIAAGKTITSDAITLDVPALADLAISIELPDSTPRQNIHPVALQTSYVSAPGSFAAATTFSGGSSLTEWFFLQGVDVQRASASAAVVVFGASSVDGFQSSVDANHRWSDELARRLAAAGKPLGVVNEGYSGNGILSDLVGQAATTRFERDVLGNSGVARVLLLEGTNDIMFSNSTADELIAGVRQLIDKAHKAGIKLIAGTLTPFEGYVLYSAQGNATRVAFNQWIRTTDELDGCVDFDKLLLDPRAPTKLLSSYDSGDHLHPNDAGYKLMGDTVDLALLE